MAKQASMSDQRLAFTFGAVFLVVILGMAVFRPEPTPFEYTVFRITLALAAAGVGAVLPGFIHVHVGNWVRAGGALGLFLIVYLVAPAAVTEPVDPTPKESASNPIPAAEAWLALVDEGKLDEAYDATAPMFRSRFNRDAMKQLLREERSALGDVVKRRFAIDQPTVNPPGVSPGAYRAIGFSTKFSKYSRPIYEGIQLRSEPTGWMVIGFSTHIKTDAGAFVPFDPLDMEAANSTSPNADQGAPTRNTS